MAQPEPQHTCGERVGRGTITWPCSLNRGHEGPHYATESQASVGERRRWEADRAHQASGLDRFQGRAQTTAERYTETPPDSDGIYRDLPPRRASASRNDDVVPPEGQSILRRDAADAREHAATLARTEIEKLGDLGRVTPRPQDHRIIPPEDGLEVLYKGDKFTLKALPDGRFMVENPEGTLGEALVLPSWIDVSDEPSEADLPPVHPQPLVDEDGTQVGFVEPPPAPTKQREGDQPLPVHNDARDAQSLVIEDIHARRAVGIQRYGVALQPFNARNVMLDIYEEALDLTVYLRQMLAMREAQREVLIEQVLAVMIEAYQGQQPEIVIRGARDLAAKIVDRILDGVLETPRSPMTISRAELGLPRAE